MKVQWLLLMFGTVIFLTGRCDFPYSPEPQTLAIETTAGSTTVGSIYPVNTSKQICNPSIAPVGPYNGCMLWLNFGGDLNVVVPSTINGYAIDRTHVVQHDRLSISDSSNAIRWFMMRNELGIAGQIQDPEWSTHPDYIACLGGDNSGNWSGYAVRISDKACCKINRNGMQETSTPHIWLPAAAGKGPGAIINPVYDPETGFCDKKTIADFFGTDSVKVVWAKGTPLSLYYIDYGSDAMLTQLVKPKDRENWITESPLISPDGEWIVYNCFSNGIYESYAQQLKNSSTPILVAANAIEPHWWEHPEFLTTYIIYAQTPAANGLFTKGDFTDPANETSVALGATCKQEVSIATGNLPAHASFALIGSPLLIVNLPFKGGMSRDGRYLCTGYEGGYLMRLN
jgi:hypothetical protein